ncbi:hypothetical protein AtNW77_Chr4g0272701 [Arabidopsis thaliana]
MEAEKETEQEGNLTVMKLPVLPTKPNTHSHSMSSPIHSSISASVPFSWEEEPGKPKQHSTSSSSSSSSSPLTSYSSSPFETHKSLELPPRLHLLEKDGGSHDDIKRMDSPSFRMMVKGSADCYGSFRSDIDGDLEDVEVDSKQQENLSSGSLAVVKKRGRLGFFGFRRRRALKGKTEFGRGSYVFPSSVDRESEYSRKEEEEEKEDKRFGYDDTDGISCSQSSRFCDVKISSISRTGSFSTLPAPPSSSSKSHFWTNVYAGLKQVVPWKSKKTTV